jgi:phage shock protein E
MRRKITFGGAILIAVSVSACSSAAHPVPAQTAPSSVERPSAQPAPAERDALLAGAALVLDVRNQDEYERGHLEGALLIPVAELEGRLGDVAAALAGDKSKKVVAYCGSGLRAGKAKDLLEQHGFSNVVNGGAYDALK